MNAINIIYNVYAEIAPPTHTHTHNPYPRLQGLLETSPSGAPMTSSGERFHTFGGEPSRDSQFVLLHTWMAPLPISSPISTSNSSWLIHDRGAAGSPQTTGWVRYFLSVRDYLQPAWRKQEKEKKITPYLVLTGPKKQAGDQVFASLLSFAHHS